MAGELMLVNPRRKTTRRRRKPGPRRTTKRRTTSRRKMSPVRAYLPNRRRRRAKTGGMGGLIGTLIPAATGGVGALALDIGWGFLPLPANIKTGPIAPFAKILGAVGLGYAARMVVSKKTADLFMTGAITVIAYNFFRGLTQRMMPTVPLGDMDYPALEYVNPGQFEPDPLIGDYVPDYETRTGPGMAEYIDYMGDYVTPDEDMGSYISGEYDEVGSYIS